MKCPKCGAEVKEGLAACRESFASMMGETAQRIAAAEKQSRPAPAKASSLMRRSSRQAGGAVAALLVVILIAAIGVASWYYFIFLRSPQYAAREFMDALKSKDYEKIYQSCMWTGPIGFVKSGQDVPRVFDMAKQFGLDITIDAYSIQEVSTEENRATVRTTVRRGGKDESWNVIMVKGEDGRWRCDLLGSVVSAIGGSLRLPSLPGLGTGR